MKVKIPVVGGICESLTGRDKGTIYVIYRVADASSVLVVDGKFKTVCNPKKKNLKHIRLSKYNAKEFGADVSCEKIHDSQIAYAIKSYKQSK